MRLKKFVAIGTAVVLSLSFLGCSKDNNDNAKNTVTNQPSNEVTDDTSTDEKTEDTVDTTTDDVLSYANIVLGESYTDVTTTIKLYNHRTDLEQDDYQGKKWTEYVADFNAMYPNITVEVETDTTYADNALLRLQSGDWGDIMMIPAVDKSDLSTYFLPYGDLTTMSNQIRFANSWEYGGQVYGVPSTGNAQGIVYNKKVFEEAGITSIPKTPEEFIAALQAIKDKTDATPLYTNYAAGWTMGAWDAYLGGSSTGESTFMNQTLLHAKEPFSDKGDGTHAYAVYKILYDAVANGLTEEDFTTTDWEGCKAMINNGQIGTMVLGSWAYPQMRDAGDNGTDIGYMSFPITINGKQYASAGGDYSYGINVNSSEDNQKAAMVFTKWMTEKSEFSYNESGIPISLADDKYPEVYAAFSGIDFISDDSAVSGEEDYLSFLNRDSDLMINNGGNTKVQQIIEHAANKDMTFDEIMAEWNAAWNAAQEANNIEVNQ